MNIQDALKQEPQYIQDSPVVQAMAQLIQIQAEQIQHQAEQIQRQTEQINQLEKTIEELKDEISRLNKTPKRHKFKPNKLEPRDRRKGNSQSNSSKKDKNICAPNKKQEEIRVEAKEVPQDSRFKGYSEFTIRALVRLVQKI